MGFGTLTILKLILLGFALAISLHMLYVFLRILKIRHDELKKLKLPEYEEVTVEDINFLGADEILWIKKISFGTGRIYLGYKKIGEDASFLHGNKGERAENWYSPLEL